MTCDDCGRDRAVTVQMSATVAEGTTKARLVHWKSCVECWKGRQK